MKILFFIQSYLSLSDTIPYGFEKAGHSVSLMSHETFFPLYNKWMIKMGGMPFKIRNQWEKKYIQLINKQIINTVDSSNPDIVFVYNNNYFLPSTIDKIKKKAKVVFYLGDSPFFHDPHRVSLQLMEKADLIISPDTGWINQLNQVGINQTYFAAFGYNPEIYFPLDLTNTQIQKYQCQVSFIGRTYDNSWGYKRCLFLNHFRNFNTKIYATGNWDKWMPLFPDLKKHIVSHQRHDQKFNNIINNCSYLCAVDANPNIFNGIHARIFDAIGSGSLPLAEYRKDIETFFPSDSIPLIKNYNEIENTTNYYICHPQIRQELIKFLKNHVDENFSPLQIAKNILLELQKKF